MMKNKIAIAGLFATWIATAPAQAGGGFEQPEVRPDIVERVGQLNRDISWHRSLDLALADGSAQDRMVMWIEMAGRLDGAT